MFLRSSIAELKIVSRWNLKKENKSQMEQVKPQKKTLFAFLVMSVSKPRLDVLDPVLLARVHRARSNATVSHNKQTAFRMQFVYCVKLRKKLLCIARRCNNIIYYVAGSAGGQDEANPVF